MVLFFFFEVGHLKVLFRGGVVGGGGRLFEAGRLLNFSTFRVGAYSRWALIRGWALNRINTVSVQGAAMSLACWAGIPVHLVLIVSFIYH